MLDRPRAPRRAVHDLHATAPDAVSPTEAFEINNVIKGAPPSAKAHCKSTFNVTLAETHRRDGAADESRGNGVATKRETVAEGGFLDDRHRAHGLASVYPEYAELVNVKPLITGSSIAADRFIVNSVLQNGTPLAQAVNRP